MDARTPQFRTKLLRALRNAYPGQDFEFSEKSDGLAVRIVTQEGLQIGREARFRGKRVADLSKSALAAQFGIEPGTA